MNTLTLGEKIKNFRTIKGFSHEELEKISGISNHTISDIENNKTKPKIETVYKLCLAMDLAVSETIIIILNCLETYIENLN